MRVVLDLSVLIEVRRHGRLRVLGRVISRGEIAIASYSLKRLRKSASWRDWLNQHQRAVEARLLPGAEHVRFAELIRRHSGSSSNPWIAEDDLMAIVIASARGWQLAMRDRNAVAVAAALGVTVLDVDEFLAFVDGPKQPRLFDLEPED